MSKQQKTRISLLSLAILGGLAISAAAQAQVMSNPTTSVKGRAPSMAMPSVSYEDVNGNGLVDTGDMLLAVDGLFQDADGDIKTPSTYRWNNGSTDLGTDVTYAIQTADLGKTITLFAVAHTDGNITDPADSVEIVGEAMVVVPGNTLLSVEISGYSINPLVDSMLTATPACITECGTVMYQWQLEDAPGSGTYSDISGATSDTYTPDRSNQKRKILVLAN